MEDKLDKKIVTASLPDPEEEVSYVYPLSFSEKERDLVVGVNGEIIRIKKGVPVTIKRKFVEVIENSLKQRQAAMDTMDRAQKAGEQAVTML